VRLIRGYKSFELINMQNFPTHTESTKLIIIIIIIISLFPPFNIFTTM